MEGLMWRLADNLVDGERIVVIIEEQEDAHHGHGVATALLNPLVAQHAQLNVQLTTSVLHQIDKPVVHRRRRVSSRGIRNCVREDISPDCA